MTQNYIIKEKKKIDKIINDLKNKVKKNGYYENLGQKELNNYLDKIDILDYQNYCELKNYFNNQLDSI